MRQPFIFSSCLIILGLMVGCAMTSTRSCIAPSGKRVDVAFSTAQSTLGNEQCWVYFDKYFENLIDIAAGDPGPHNLQRFSDYISWSFERGIVSRMESKALYSRYFSAKFVALPADRSSCVVSKEFGRIQTELDAELRDKYKGLTQVAATPADFARAQREKRALEDIFEALRVACN